MFTRSAAIYDAVYSKWDYAALANRLHGLIQRHRRTADAGLLDVACGTGSYLFHLRSRYAVEGVDLDPGMLAVARRKVPDVPLHQADMAAFDVGRQFGAVVCLGSSIGYARTLPRLRQAVASLARHALPGGVVIVEPWFSSEVWEVGRLTAELVDRPDLKIARILVSTAEDTVSILDIHYLVARREGVEHFSERHELGLFSDAEYLDAFRDADLDVCHDPEGLLGRGLYIGLKPQVP